LFSPFSGDEMGLSFAEKKHELPVLGIGLGLRREIAQETFEHAQHIDWLEIIPENYMGIGGKARLRLEQAQALFPMVSHGVNLSIGSCDSLNHQYLEALKSLLHYIKAPWFSDHLCFSSVAGNYLHDLLPLPLNEEALKLVVERAIYVQDYFQRPFLLENISYYMTPPGSTIEEVEFLTSALELADCGLLLDVNNVYVNSINHNFNPYSYIDALPLERVVQIHIAGHSRGEELLIDTHGADIIEPVYELLAYVLRHCEVKAILLERDQNFPDFSEILDELKAIRKIVAEVQPQLLKSRSAGSVFYGEEVKLWRS
jgi:uncharacterized protein (UPF0276 family)